MNWTIAAGAAFMIEAAAVAACLWLCLRLKRRNAALERAFRAELEGQQEAVNAVRLAVRRLEERQPAGAPRAAAPPEPLPEPAHALSLNLSRRSQALRMHRRGELPEMIASTLRMPRNEVELLVKVHRSFSDKAAGR